MPALAYGTSAYRRDAGALPEIRLVNMFVEQAPTSEGAVALLSRPGLEPVITVGSGPIQALYSGDGVLGGGLFAVSGGRLFDGSADRGAVDIAGAVRIAASANQMLIAAGSQPSLYDGVAVSDPGFPDGASVASVAYLAGLFFGIRAGTQRFYWSAVRDASSWDGLDYASAESSPDPLLEALVVGDILWLLGSSSIEPWAPTGDADLPVSKIEARTYQRGVKATGCATDLDNTLFWIGDDGVVYRGAAVPERLSDHGIEERIAASSSLSARRVLYAGHKFFCVRLDTKTFAYDVATQQWCEFATGDFDNWCVAASCEQDGVSLLGDAANGSIYRFSDVAQDDAGRLRPRLFTALAPTKTDVSLDTLALEADYGGAPLLIGQGSDPVIEMRSSRDSGQTWAAWRPAPLGKQGQYRNRSEWRRMGAFDAPGGMFEFRTTDAVPLRISAVNANDGLGGRSR